MWGIVCLLLWKISSPHTGVVTGLLRHLADQWWAHHWVMCTGWQCSLTIPQHWRGNPSPTASPLNVDVTPRLPGHMDMGKGGTMPEVRYLKLPSLLWAGPRHEKPAGMHPWLLEKKRARMFSKEDFASTPLSWAPLPAKPAQLSRKADAKGPQLLSPTLQGLNTLSSKELCLHP